uniref:Uncharacterized protein n=1 Tax=uncultured bacterium esnapd22 TaxID=1366604 RepID=S5TLL8_9BACT|nr:hypothetical protein [uncultured bacterium esnapd22]
MCSCDTSVKLYQCQMILRAEFLVKPISIRNDRNDFLNALLTLFVSRLYNTVIIRSENPTPLERRNLPVELSGNESPHLLGNKVLDRYQVGLRDREIRNLGQWISFESTT